MYSFLSMLLRASLVMKSAMLHANYAIRASFLIAPHYRQNTTTAEIHTILPA